jgi:nicotinamidase-related amidase
MTLLCKPDECTLLIVDTQARLMPAIHEGENVVRRCVQLATAARELGIHVIGTEENPDGLGRSSRDRGAVRHDARQVPLLGAGRGRLPAPPARRPRHARRRRLRGARLRAADGDRPARSGSLR